MTDTMRLRCAAQQAAVNEQPYRLGWRKEYRADRLPLFRTGKTRRRRQLEAGKMTQQPPVLKLSLRSENRARLRAKPGGGIMTERRQFKSVAQTL